MLAGKKGIIFGIANNHSIAWGIAKKLRENGAILGITYQNETLLKRAEPLAKEINSEFLIKCDFSNDKDIDECYKKFQLNGILLILLYMLLLTLINQNLMEDI